MSLELSKESTGTPFSVVVLNFLNHCIHHFTHLFVRTNIAMSSANDTMGTLRLQLQIPQDPEYHICKGRVPDLSSESPNLIIIMIRFVARTYPPCWVLKARIQKHRGKPLLFHDKCPGFLYVHYTTHGTYSFTSHPKDEAIMVKCLAQGHKRRDRPGRQHQNLSSMHQTARPQHSI